MVRRIGVATAVLGAGVAALLGAACGSARRAAPARAMAPSTAAIAVAGTSTSTSTSTDVPPQVAPTPSPPRAATTLPRGATKDIASAAFSADGKSIDVVREGSAVVERYELATGARTEAAAVETAPAAPSGALFDANEVTLRGSAAEQRTLAAIAREIGASVRDGDGASVVSSSTALLGTDGAHFFLFDGPAGWTIVRLDTGARAAFKPWTNGFSGMGGRTGGEVSFAFGPDVDRAIVSSASQMGANVAFDDPRLLDTRTMKVLGSLPPACQPFRLDWSSRGAFIARRECWTGRLVLSDGKTAAHIRSDEVFNVFAFSGDESLIAGSTADGGLLVARTSSGERVLRVAGPQESPPLDLAFSRDGKRLLVGHGSTIDVWDLETGEGRIVDTHAPGPELFVLDADASAAWIDERWLALAGTAPAVAPRSKPDVGTFDMAKLGSPKGATPKEGFEVSAAAPRPGSQQSFIAGRRTQADSVQGGISYPGKRFAVIDSTTNSVEHVYDDDALDDRDWAWTEDGAHLVIRASAGLAVLSPDLRGESVGPTPIALQPSQPLSRLVDMFGTLDRIVRGAELLSAVDVAPIAAPRAVHPSLRFVAFAVGPSVVVADRAKGGTLRLTCAPSGTKSGCFATTEDGRWAASAAIAPLLVHSAGLEGETREQPDLVKTFFAP
jgi:hypothetical protein